MGSKIELFRDTKEFIVVVFVLLLIVATRLFFIYQDYTKLKSLDDYYYTTAYLSSVYNQRDGDLLLKLKAKDFDFFLKSRDKSIEPKVWVRARIKLDKSTTFLDYLRGFYARGNIVEIKERAFDKKELLREKIASNHSSKEISSFYNAIFLAEPLDRNLREKISTLGASHLVALSGFHLGILSIVIFAIFYLPYRVFQYYIAPYRNQNIDLGFLTLVVLAFYIWFVGAQPALLRAYGMIAVGWVILLLGYELVSFRLLAVALILIVAIFPKLLFSYAFLLSAGGVFYIFLILKYFKDYSSWIVGLVVVPVGVFLLMFPISHYLFPNTSILQLASPILSVAFVLFYPLTALLHIFNMGGAFDSFLDSLFMLADNSVDVYMPKYLIVFYLVLSFGAIFNKKLFWLLLFLSAIITLWSIGLSI